MTFANVFDTKVVHNEDKGDWAPLVSPEAGREVALIVPMELEPFKEQVVGKFSGLFESVDSFVDFEIYPSSVCVMCEIVLVDEFLRDVTEFDPDIFSAVKWRAEVEVGDVITCKTCVFGGEDAVELEFDEFE